MTPDSVSTANKVSLNINITLYTLDCTDLTRLPYWQNFYIPISSELATETEGLQRHLFPLRALTVTV